MQRSVLHFLSWGGFLGAGMYAAYMGGAHFTIWLYGLVAIPWIDEMLEHFVLKEDPDECMLDAGFKSLGLLAALSTAGWWWR